jgi:hypothetical protein
LPAAGAADAHRLRASCPAARPQAAFPHPATDEHRACVELLGALNADITRRALALMAAGDAPALGALMTEAQRLFRQRAAPLCPSQLASPVLHAVLAHPPIQPHIYGGKGVGSQVRAARGCGWEGGSCPFWQHAFVELLLAQEGAGCAGCADFSSSR